jgi:phage terminase large subunit GpA-like protein
MQATCSLLQGYKFVEPLASRRGEHEKARKGLKERWQKERKRIQEAVALLLKAKAAYMQRTQDYERCRDALRVPVSRGSVFWAGKFPDKIFLKIISFIFVK